MRESGAPDLLWTDGEMTLRVTAPGLGADRLVRVRRPYALVGRSTGADVRLDDPSVSGRHLYLHLDRRGVFAVDLLTRTGTADENGPISTAWLQVGKGLVLAGFRVELVEMRVHGVPLEPAPCLVDPITEFTASDAPQVRLEPRTARESRWILNSELVFLGRSAGCGVRVDGGSAARIHGVIVRTVRDIYLVDLIGRLIWLNRRPIRGASPLHDGDILTVGSSEFTIHIEAPRPTLPAPLERTSKILAVPDPIASVGHETLLMPRNYQSSPVDTQEAFLGWLFGLFQAGQGELLRRQGDFQLAMTEAMQQMRDENSALLNTHLEKVELIHREISSLRSQIEALNPGSTEPSLPKPAPIKIPARPDSPANGAASANTTAWLIERISSLENESRSSWRDLFSRMGSSNRPSD